MAYATVTSNGSAGGIVGRIASSVIIIDCKNYGYVTSVWSSAGSILGSAYLIQNDKAIKDIQDFIRNNRDKIKDPDSARPMTFHGLRHLCAAEWYLSLTNSGYNKDSAMKQVSRWLGHERKDVTRIYLASLPRIKGSGE